MDAELRFIAALLAAPKKEQDRLYSQKPSLKLFSVRGNEVQYLYRHYEKYGHFPSAEIFSQRFQVELTEVTD